MKYLAIIGIWMGLAWTSLSAQDQIVNDVAPEPFVGTVHYQLTHTGPNSAKWAAHLPDSMTIRSDGRNLLVQLWNGVADSLVSDYLYLADSDAVYVLDHVHQLGYGSPNGYEAKPLSREAIGQDTILDHEVDVFRVGGKDEVAVSAALYFPVSERSEATQSRPTFLQSGLRGIPLRMVRRGQMVMTAEAVSISSDSHSIQFPEGYSTEAFFSRKLRHPYFPNERE